MVTWASTRAPTPPPPPPPSRREARASISSKKMMEGAAARARRKSAATARSDSPTHLEKSSGPLTARKLVCEPQTSARGHATQGMGKAAAAERSWCAEVVLGSGPTRLSVARASARTCTGTASACTCIGAAFACKCTPDSPKRGPWQRESWSSLVAHRAAPVHVHADG